MGAALLGAALVVSALIAVFLRAESGFQLAPADWAALRFTLWQAMWSALFSTLLAIPVARALARRQFRGRGFLISLLGAPFILPVIVAILGLLAIFGRAGLLNAALAFLGLPALSIYGMHGVVLAHVFFNLPLATRLLLQGWQSIPAERFRLVAQLGLPASSLFRLIEWPLLVRTLPSAFALIFVICLTSFAVALTLGGGPKATTLELAIYQAFRFDFDLSRAALLSALQLGIAGGAAILALWLVPSVSFGTGLDRSPQRWDAKSGWQAVMDGAWILFALGFLMLPLMAVVISGLKGISEMPITVWHAAWTSLWMALLSVSVMLGFALPMAGWIATSKWAGTEAIGLFGLAASPLMIGTGWFILIYPFTAPANRALEVTLVVNALMALPFSLRILVPNFRETAENYAKLSMAMGLSGLHLWRLVLLPRARAQIGFAAGLTAALSVGDLGVIALFADPERATLPLQMYRLMGSYRTDAAAGAALVLLVLAFGLFWMLDYWGRRNVDTG